MGISLKAIVTIEISVYKIIEGLLWDVYVLTTWTVLMADAHNKSTMNISKLRIFKK